MANVTLVRPAFTPHIYGSVYSDVPAEREIRPPLGLAYLAASLESQGHKVRIVDGEPKLLDLGDTVDRIMETSPDFVGITSTTPEFNFATDILKAVKSKDRKIVTMAGGSHVSALPEYTIDRHPEVDYVVVAEGENGILRVMDRPRERVIRSRGPHDEIDPNKNPWPARHLLNYDNYAYGDPAKGIVRSDAIEGQRSCPYKCHFCFRGVGTELRMRDVGAIADELEHTYRVNKVQHAIWFDDTLTASKKRAHQLCDEILRRGIDMSFYCFTASNTLNKELLEHMKRAGFSMITLGIESGNQDILSSVGKAAKLGDYVIAYTAMAELGIETRGSVILGHPFENHGTIWDTIDFVLEGIPLQRLGVNVLMPFPGTRTWFQTLAKDGLRFATPGLDGVRDDWSSYKRWGNAVIETTGMTTGEGLSREDLMFYHDYLLMRFYTHPRVVGHAFDQVFKGNVSDYYHRPVVSALKRLAAFERRERETPHRFSNGMTLKEVEEDVRANRARYDVKDLLAASKKRGIKDAAPMSFPRRAPPVALPSSGLPGENGASLLPVAASEAEQPLTPSTT